MFIFQNCLFGVRLLVPTMISIRFCILSSLLFTSFVTSDDDNCVAELAKAVSVNPSLILIPLTFTLVGPRRVGCQTKRLREFLPNTQIRKNKKRATRFKGKTPFTLISRTGNFVLVARRSGVVKDETKFH